MKHKLFLRRLTFLMAFMLSFSAMWGEVTYTISTSLVYNSTEKGYPVENVGTLYKATNGGTYSITAASGSDPAYVTSGNSVFIFKPAIDISKMVIHAEGTGNKRTISAIATSSSLNGTYTNLTKTTDYTPSGTISSSAWNDFTLVFVNPVESGTYIKITLSGNCKISSITMTEASTDPKINASNVTIGGEATSGEIAYTISNSIAGVYPTAVKTTGDWISNVQVNTANKKVTFDATPNTGIARIATITISYTGAEDNVVTITQRNPNEVIYNFNDKNAYPSGFPTGGTSTASAKTFTIDGNEIIINAPNSYYTIYSTDDAKRGLFYGQTAASNGKPTDATAYLGFPARQGYKLVRVVATTTATVAGSVKMNIYDASWNSYSTELSTTSSTKKEFTFALSNTTENTAYRLASGSSSKNLQFDNIVLTYEPVAKKYDVNFYVDGSVDESLKKSVEENGHPETVNPTKRGYTFDGWYSDDQYENKVADITTVTITKATNFYGRFIENIHSLRETLSHVTATGTHPTSISEIATEDLTLTYEVEDGYRFPSTISVTDGTAALSAEKYAWDENNGTLVIDKSAFMTNIVITIAAEEITEKTIYLDASKYWNSGSYYVYYWGDGISAGWADKMVSADCGVTFSASIPLKATNVIFVDNTSAAFPDAYAQRSVDVTLGDNNLFTFVGEDNYKKTYSAGTYVPSYTITYNMQGHGAEIAAVCCKTSVAPDAPVAVGFTFGGWFTDEACENEYTFGTMTEDVEVFAKWTAVENRTIHLNPIFGDQDWSKDNVTIFVSAWIDGKSGSVDVKMTSASDCDAVVKADIPTNANMLLFARCAPGAESIIWGDGKNVYNQTDDITISETINLYNITAWEQGYYSHSGCEVADENYVVTTPTYTKVASASDMVIGGTYVWYAENSSNAYVAAPFSGTNTYFGAIGVTKAADDVLTLSCGAEYQKFVLNQLTATTWSIGNEDNTKTLRVSGGNKIAWFEGVRGWTLSNHKEATTPTLVSNDSLMQYNYNSGKPRFNVYKGTQDDAFLYRLASESAHTLTLNLNYTDAPEAKTYLVKEGYAWTPIAPTRSGYDFSGWATSATGSVVYAPTVAYTMPNDDSELFAVWAAISSDPEVTPSVNSVDVTSDKLATGTATFTITGQNLTQGLSLAFESDIEGLSVSPSVIEFSAATLAETTITISYVNTAAAEGSVALEIKHGESTLANVTVNYTSTAAITEIADVTGAMTWDFGGYTTDVQPDLTDQEVVLANYVTLTTGDASMLKGKQQYIVRKSFCWQGTQLVFHPTVAGTVEVEWCSTSGSNYRTLAINGTKIDVAGYNSTTKKKSSANVSANQDVVLTGWNVTGTAPNFEYTSNQIRIWSITFVPAVATIPVTTAQYATYYNAEKAFVMPEGLEGIVVSKQTGTTLTLDVMYTADGANGTESIVPAGEPLLLHATTELTEPKSFILYSGTTNEPTCKELEMNLLSGTSTADELTTDGDKYYRLSIHDGKVGFYWGAAEGAAFKPGANKAYLALNGASAPDRFIFNPSAPITTGVDDTLNKYVKSGKTLINGKLYIIRDSKVYDLNGRLVK